jgi:RNA polymerase sigma-70 factor (ECF subfamily)
MSSITNTTLLLGLKALENDRVWSEFCAKYQPVLVAVGRRLGLSEHDAQDAAQETLLAFVDAYKREKYSRQRGRLRTWLLGIATHKIRDIQRKRGRDAVIDSPPDKTQLMAGVADEHVISEAWEAEWQRAAMESCLKKVYEHLEISTIQAFELFVIKEWPAEKVAEHLSISRNAVFKAKRRVLSRMRETYKQIDGEL